jgi:hypothetical protein
MVKKCMASNEKEVREGIEAAYRAKNVQMEMDRQQREMDRSQGAKSSSPSQKSRSSSQKRYKHKPLDPYFDEGMTKDAKQFKKTLKKSST